MREQATSPLYTAWEDHKLVRITSSNGVPANVAGSCLVRRANGMAAGVGMQAAAVSDSDSDPGAGADHVAGTRADVSTEVACNQVIVLIGSRPDLTLLGTLPGRPGIGDGERREPEPLSPTPKADGTVLVL